MKQPEHAAANDCDTGPVAPPLAVEAALALLLDHARPLTDVEDIPTAEARNRILAEPVPSRVDLPGWDNSAMDGYAIRHADLVQPEPASGPAPTGRRLRIAQRIAAGHCGQPLAPGTAARIFTGAPVPANADTVVVQEICQTEGDSLIIPTAALARIQPGANVRRRGEECHAGDVILTAGIRLAAEHLGLAAGAGVERLPVYRRLRVAIFASGDELRMPGEPLSPGQIYNSNRFLLRALLETLDCEVIDLGIVADTLDATVEALQRAAGQADLVLASGGVSVGEEDHVRPAVQKLGRLDLWRIAMRPGKPLAFGHIGETPFIGSPGNPVSLFVTFGLFARPFIQRMQGVDGDLAPRYIRARADFDSPRPDKRREYQRARLDLDQDGEPRVQVFPSRSSAALSSLVWANGLVVVPEGRTIRSGDPVQFIPMGELAR
ncbi:molybdopterin molybdotransferase MoeA [Thiohalocapsa marina]|uniref:Molybdopterin molybdenumtransferase n=1 Tax=Thiohalocapsa marina TaxID=424902 RepID=A0A5M8FR47_9GAMM|nr:gephyrin-like molybdotransferase Glp [Thiohalocapsa marina]KAA6185831.1 molybdopterin molybdotransferase MoeA [Thiohalocapsa marina]